jgi:hypothetical protein
VVDGDVDKNEFTCKVPKPSQADGDEDVDKYEFTCKLSKPSQADGSIIDSINSAMEAITGQRSYDGLEMEI